jgi:hypothetical protein
VNGYDEISPDDGDVGWKLARGDHQTFWAIRALIEMRIFSVSEVQQIEKDGVTEGVATSAVSSKPVS